MIQLTKKLILMQSSQTEAFNLNPSYSILAEKPWRLNFHAYKVTPIDLINVDV